MIRKIYKYLPYIDIIIMIFKLYDYLPYKCQRKKNNLQKKKAGNCFKVIWNIFNCKESFNSFFRIFSQEINLYFLVYYIFIFCTSCDMF